MIFYDLICQDGLHQFEGCFGSSADFDDQKKRGLLTCPICESPNVAKAIMAPNIGAKGNQSTAHSNATWVESSQGQKSVGADKATSENSVVQVPKEYQDMIGKIAKAQKELLSKSEWVGEKFPEKARAIHYGDSEQKPIHGTATPEEVAELDEEGVEVLPLPLPVTPPESQN